MNASTNLMPESAHSSTQFLHVNGKLQRLLRNEPRLLIDTLREDLELTGTHQGCDTAQCGACTVLCGGKAIKSCNVLTQQVQGLEICTIESVANTNGLHVMQQAFSTHHALQCGYCTPGFIMRALAMHAEGVPPEPLAVRHALGGNLCRCTGYEGIVAAICKGLSRINGATP